MGLTYEQAERLGIAAEHPDHPARRGEKTKARGPKLNALGMNKTEARFASYLAELRCIGCIREFRFEPFKLRLAGRTYYSPDFCVRRNDGSLVIFEIKGFMRDDAACKLKTAAEQFAWLGPFYLVRADRACTRGWDVRPVTRTGVGNVPVGEGWLGV